MADPAARKAPESAGIGRGVQHAEIEGQTAVNPRNGLAVGILLAHVPSDVGIVLQNGQSAAATGQNP